MACGNEGEGADRKLRVAVVGGGPSGIAACRFLRDSGHEPTVFETGQNAGGVWAAAPTNTVIYRGLVTNIPTVAMQSPDLEFPPGLPSYLRTADMGRYFVSYLEHFELGKFVRFSSEVTSVRPLRTELQEESGDSCWEVAFHHGGQERAELFDAVVVAKGHYDEPYIPEVPGQALWLASASSSESRTVIHSRDYDDPACWASRSILIVGGRSSGTDIARELRSVASWVYVLDRSCEQIVSAGNCTHVPLGSGLRADGRIEVGEDVAPGPPVDAIILATGYKYVFPFLESSQVGLEFGPNERHVEPLYQHMIHARRPSLCFVGIPLAVPTPLLIFEAQSCFIASHLRQNSLTKHEMESWVQNRRQNVGERLQDMHFLGEFAWAYMREVMGQSGLWQKALEAYLRRLEIVHDIYQDRCNRRPELPWGDDCYRRVQYEVNWDEGSWKLAPKSI